MPTEKWSTIVLNQLQDREYVYLGDPVAVYAVKSMSHPVLWHQVTVYRTDDGELRTCTCKGFRGHDHCYHLELVP